MISPGGVFGGQGDSLPCPPDLFPVLHLGSWQSLQRVGFSLLDYKTRGPGEGHTVAWLIVPAALPLDPRAARGLWEGLLCQLSLPSGVPQRLMWTANFFW